MVKKAATKKKAPHKKAASSRVPQQPDTSGYDDLYVSMSDAIEKRKNILNSIKHALIMQEEHEKVVDIRKRKGKLIKDIKVELDHINSLYQKLRKHLPNVKNVLTHTEQELKVLQGSIDNLKAVKNAEVGEEVVEEVVPQVEEVAPPEPEKKLKSPKPHHKHKAPNKHSSSNMTRIDRIQNNLKVIESKLKDF